MYQSLGSIYHSSMYPSSAPCIKVQSLIQVQGSMYQSLGCQSIKVWAQVY